ncbi:MAG TPA: hypothetical protein VFM46_13540, partial [Pseudomonadales bacterium]|nr:hypothetical protein [Pseudomonadales bacterium]
TGSYRNNTEGGILRSNIRNFASEINQSTGQVNDVGVSDDSIIKTLDSLRIAGIQGRYNGDPNGFNKVLYSDVLSNCGTRGVVPQIQNGECRDWGNPLGEIVFETLRYFDQQTAPTAAFVQNNGSVNTDAVLGLTEPAWRNPFNNSGMMCANKFQLLISDSTPSYDMDQVPGSPFNPHAPTFHSLNMKTEADTIFTHEYGSGPIQAYVGERSGFHDDLAPTPKTISSLGDIRGIAPNTPTKEGGYSSAALALYARSDRSNLKLRTFAVSIPNDVPKITIKVDGKDVTLQPFGKSEQSLCGQYLSEYYIDTSRTFRPTNQIANFYIEKDIGTSGSFVVNYEDQEQGSDYDMDTAVRYNWKVEGTKLIIDAEAFSHLSCVEQHVGLSVDGTTNDGVHLLVTGFRTFDPDRNEYVTRGVVDHELDLFTPADFLATLADTSAYLTQDASVPETRLGYRSHVEFTVRNGGATTVTLKDPLWYAAKYGAQLGDALPTDENAADWRNNTGAPQNYFLAQNPANLQTQLREVMGLIERQSRQTSLTSLAVSAGSLSDGLTLYQASFNPEGWSGNIKAIALGESGNTSSTLWDARLRINAQFSGSSWQNRNVVTWDPYLSSTLYARKGVPFIHTGFWDAALRQSMSPTLFSTMLLGATPADADRAEKV